ncbi:hypothetical protein SLEP1_g26065 [Rubroshorea leprosula]|uniref:Uncharacterized protein n=1 Tax=Rubroshorea leprosula TaxID=152421 RepID=A0AAV5JV75_9ROSI|nr:hypothetical protein SLEP1_g26065 [Rubroshorea leprosula]
MSSEETLSIGGSEEVRMLEYSDVSVEEEVPVNILEVGDRSDKFYDSGADIVSEVKGYESELKTEMDKLLGAARVAIPKKPRKKSKTLEKAASGKGDGNTEKGQMSSTEARAAEEVELRSKRKRDEVDQAQKKKRRVEDEVRGDEVVEFVPRPAPVELDPDLRETEVLGPGKGKAFVPSPSLQSSIFGNNNFSTVKNFINTYVPEVDRRKAREEALVHGGTSVVRHALEERNILQKERDELLKKNGEMKRELDIVVPTVTSLQEERDTLKTILSFEEKKRRMCEEENEAQEEEIRRMRESEVELKKNVQLLVHNGMKEHISNFINSSLFENIVNLYRLPTTILAFIDCKKKVKTKYPEVDITKITFDKQEEGVEENKRKHVNRFPTSVEEEEREAKGVEVEESQPSPPMEVHLVPSEEEQPPFPTEQEPPQPSHPAE